MTDEKLCGGKTFKEVMEEVNFHILDKHKIEQLQKENAELKKDKEYLDKVNNEQTEVILKLQAQIEKMKCPENCKHYLEYEIICPLGNGYCICDKWELAE